jgi:membrane-bound metal-dependent hydrolase YbcI (DUF457 family)
MMKKSHLAIGIMGTLAIYQNIGTNTETLFLLCGAFVGSILPDLDLKLKIPHRGITHWLIWPALILYAGHSYPFVMGMCFGWMLHIGADALTVEGLHPLEPISSWRIYGIARTGALSEYLIVVPVLVGLFYLIRI